MVTTQTKFHIIEDLRKEFGLPFRVTECIASNILREICQALKAGEAVKITGFGTFKCLHKKERVGRNPKTGDTAIISARRVVTFKPSTSLRNAVKKQCTSP